MIRPAYFVLTLGWLVFQTLPTVTARGDARAAAPTAVLGGGSDPTFQDAAPPPGLLAGLDVGLGTRAGSDVVCAVRPIFVTPQGADVPGTQHGGDWTRMTRLKAKPGYAVGALNVRIGPSVQCLSLTYMKIDVDRLDPRQSYESEWVGAKAAGPTTKLGGDGTAVVGIVGRQNSRDCSGLGLLLASAGSTPKSVSPDGRPTEGQTGKSILPSDDFGRDSEHPIRFQRGPAPPPPGIAALDKDRVVRNLPEPTDAVAAGGGGRFLLFHLPKFRKLAVFDVTQAKIARYLSLSSDDVLFAAGSEKLLVVSRDRSVIQRFDLQSLKKELTVMLPEVGKVEGLGLGYCSTGPALLATRNGPKFVDVSKLSFIDPPGAANPWNPNRPYLAPPQLAQVRASADGSTYAIFEPMYGRNCVWTLDGRTAHRGNAPSGAGTLQPGFDGNLFFGWQGVYSSDLKPVAAEQFRGQACFPAYHPAYFLACSVADRAYRPNQAAERAKLSLYATADKRLLASLTDFEELNDPRQPASYSPQMLSIDQRIHFFPTANLLLIVSPARDQLILHKLDVMAVLEKAGIDYLYVASLPPATAERGGTFNYQIEVKSRRGGVHCTLDSGPDGMTLSDDGKLLWKVPADEPAGQQGVIITIRDSSGQEIMHTFNIVVP
jgi:hypothetical protein